MRLPHVRISHPKNLYNSYKHFLFLHLQTMPIFQTHSPHSFTSTFPSTLKPNSSPFIHSKPQRLVLRATKTDYYKTLNLDRNATLKDIKTSYRKLARQYHPDMNEGFGAEDKFKEISAAYEVLSDEEKRATYDRFGEEGLRGEYGSPNMGSAGYIVKLIPLMFLTRSLEEEVTQEA